MKKIVLVPALLLASTLMLTGCGILGAPTPTKPDTTSTQEPALSPEPTEPSVDPNAPEANSDGIVTLTPDQVIPADEFTKSTPAGTWNVASSLPKGFPSGVPAYSGRLIKNEFTAFTTGDGLEAYGAMFWGSYAEVDVLLSEFEAQGYRIDGDVDDGKKRVISVESPDRRVTITATESAVDTLDGGLLDPTFNYTIVITG